jgi:hypothetical protein
MHKDSVANIFKVVMFEKTSNSHIPSVIWNVCIILLVVLYGCETWSLTLREEHRWSTFKNRVLRIFGPKRDRVPGGWRRLHNEKPHNLYTSLNIIRAIKSGGGGRRGRRVAWERWEIHKIFWLENIRKETTCKT